jgi:hypothetical protein
LRKASGQSGYFVSIGLERPGACPQGIKEVGMWRMLFMIAMLLHGIGHILFLMNTWGYWKTASERAWLFADGLKLSQTGEGMIGLLWLAPLLGFVVGAWGYVAQQTWWQPLVLTAVMLSSAMILLWWSGLNTSSAFFALAFNLLVFVVVLWQQRMFQLA